MSAIVAQNGAQMAPRKSLMATMASKYGMEPAALEQTLRATIFPSGKEASREQVAAFMVVALEYDLNPFLKEIYAYPAKGGGIVPVVGVDGWAKVATRGGLDGAEFSFIESDGGVEACSAAVYRKGNARPIVVTEYLHECRQETKPWQNMPRRMLRHKAFIQAVRLAFGISGIKDEDEAERLREVDAVTVPEIAAAKRADKVADRINQAKAKKAPAAVVAPVEVEPQAAVVMVEQEQPAEEPIPPAPQLTSDQRRLAWINDAIKFGGERVERLLAGTSPEQVASDSDKYVAFKAKAKALIDQAEG
jgi:phage recombination protein Bet